jgi:hypothetical protein
MTIPKITGAQRDFSAGELDVEMKRADDNPIMKTGARQMLNWRILNSHAVKQRPGRTALFKENGPRVEPILMRPGQLFYLAFGAGYLRIYNAAGALVAGTTVMAGSGGLPLPWTAATVGAITYVVSNANSQFAVYIFFADGAPNNRPQLLLWDGVSQTSTWTLQPYLEAIAAGGQKRTFFSRISPPNITMQPSAVRGAINIAFSGAVLVAGMVGARMRYAGRQISITGVSGPQNGTAQVIEPLPPGQTLTISASSGFMSIGDVIRGASSGAVGIVITTPTQQAVTFTYLSGAFMIIGASVTGAPSGATGTIIAIDYGTGTATISLTTATLFAVADTVSGGGGAITLTSVGGASLVVQLIPASGSNIIAFIVETVVGQSGTAAVSAVATVAPQAIAVWDDEVMNTFRGYPSSVFFDQSRLGMCNFPSVPSAIGWSGLSLPTDLYVGSSPQNAIFNLAPGNVQVQYVVPGMESSEFVFTDTKIFYIPITPQIPLIPGNVNFNELASHGSMPGVQPKRAQQSVVYMPAGGGVVGAVQSPGSYNRPYIIDSLSELHAHLFTASPAIAIAIPSAATQFEENYIYITLRNGTVVVGRYEMKQGLIEAGQDGKPRIGWSPWNGVGTVLWTAALQDAVIFTTSYTSSFPSFVLVEQLDANQYLDMAIAVNNLPAAFVPPAGRGPLFAFANGPVTLMDQGYRMMGTYQVDGNGFIVPQGNGGENLASASLIAGQAWTSILEPFVPDAQPGQDVGQRMFKRRIARFAAYVSNSTGFVMARLFSGPLTRVSPALGTVMNSYRVPAWNQDDDATQPPPLREEAQRSRPLGRSFDPRVAIVKDTPGPLTIHELGTEATI